MESEDAGGDGGGRMSPDDRKDVKRRMKSKEQLQALEKAYNEHKYPLESTRAELSATLKLTDKQLQVWFSHRRLKDRKVEDNPSATSKKAKNKEKPATDRGRVASADHVQEDQGPQQQQPSQPDPHPQQQEQEQEEERLVMSLQPSRPQSQPVQQQQQQPALVSPPPDQSGAEAGHAMEDSEWEAAPPASKARRKNTDSPAVPKRKPPAKGRRTAAELAALKAFEAQMAEGMREDGPPVGFEFDPIPPIGFAGHPTERDLPLDPPEEQEDVPRVAVRRGLNARKVKAAARNRPPLPTTNGVKRKAAGKAASTSTALPHTMRPVREYQFIPEQPTGRPEEQNLYDKATELNLYPNAERPFDVVSASRVRSLTQPAPPIFPSNEAYTAGEGYYQARVVSVGASMFPTAEAGAGGLIAPNDINFEGGQRVEGLPSYDVDPSKALFHLASRHDNHARHESLNLYQEQDRARLEKKRKMEEAKLHKEMEAQEKRMKKELDKQEIARRREEEQRKKDAEKQMREKKKEQEKIQKEQERKMREAQREEERNKKQQEKESKRLEKLRQKEELRQQKEAAKVKAANEKATAKKLAKENAETVDDERLELMELAIAALGLSSVAELPPDDGVDILEEYRPMLKPFPPPSVKMKQAVLIRPWTDNEENFSNALMVFRFLISFADVLGLWSFTFDELLQAFHDYDPRLLGDIHVALLRTLVKDVEEASQAAVSVPGGSQYASFVISGGHPEIVESAYRWGFDIREWRTHLGPLTWPEILRQFALAAGIGPKWKTRKVEPSQAKVNVKVTEGEDVVSTLRSGAAAANAVALMQGKGVGQVRRNQYRMTPGTVKFAAFHILSLEGDKGLSIPQVADLMQKTGLRDLSLSRTPEASIAAALSRDANLFERVAPSTYCVRPAFRKDPADREQVLDAAREKIALFKSGQLEGEEADKEVEDPEEGEEALRDEEYGLEEHEVDDKATYAELTPGKAESPSKSDKPMTLGDDNDAGERDFQSPEHLAADRNVSCPLTGGVNNAKHGGDIKDGGTRPECTKPELPYAETEIDESQAGEAWVLGLAEGEYGDLSVEERLNALVALVNVVNEGTTIRVALEDRLESAQALKRQMWVEAQLDRRRSKDEPTRLQVPGTAGGKVEGASPSGVLDGRHSSPLLSSDSKQDIAQHGLQNAETGGLNAGEGNVVISAKKPSAGQDLIAAQDVSVPAFAHPSEKSRAQLKADIGLRAEELFVCRSVPLGFDRRRNRYWQFVTSNGGEDPGCARIYFESVDGRWEVLNTEESLDALMTSLDIRGCRESGLHQSLLRLEGSIRSAMRKQQNLQGDVKVETRVGCHGEAETGSRHEPSGIIACTAVDGSPASGVYGQDTDFLDRKAALSLDLGKNEHQRRKALERYRDLVELVWGASPLRAKSFKKRDQELLSNCSVCHDFYWLRDKHCPHCHGTFDQSSKIYTRFLEHTRECEDRMRNGDPSWKSTEPLPCRFQHLKSQLLAIEGAIPTAALKVPWKDQQRKTWISNLKQATASGEVLQALADLEDIVSRDWLLSSYDTTEEMLKNVPESVENHSIDKSNSRVLPWIPQTTAAVALQVSLFDAAIAYTHEEKLHREKQKEEDAKMAKAGVSAVKTSPELVPADRNGANGAEDGTGDGPVDGKGRSRKKRADGQPKNKSKARTSGGGGGGIGGRDGGGSGNGKLVGGAKSSVGAGKNVGGSGKRGLKRKLHFSEDGAGVTADAVDNQLHAKDQRRPRSGTGKAGGRPRGRPPGRPRNKVAGSVSRGGRKSKVAKQKERDPNELMASAAERQRKVSQARAPHHDEDTDEDDEGYQYVDDQGDWGPPDDTDEGEQYEEEQLDEDNGEYMEEDGSGDGMDEDVSGDPGHGHLMSDRDEEDEPVDEDDARCEDDDGYTGLQDSDDEATGYAEDASEDDAGERMPSYSSSDE